MPMSGGGGGISGLTLTNGNLGIGTKTKLSKVTVQGNAQVVSAGTTTANNSTTITGVSTFFLKDVGIGDRISLSSAATTYGIVTSIASDTSLVVATALGNGSSQTINITKSFFRVQDYSAITKLIVNDLGNIGIGITNPFFNIDANTSSASFQSVAVGNFATNVDKRLAVLTSKAQTRSLTGTTVTNSTYNKILNGTGTLFLTELSISDDIIIEGNAYTVWKINSNTQ